MSKGGFIQIPHKVIRNPNINCTEFVMLMQLKYSSYTNGNVNEFDVDLQKLKCAINIGDTRTIKKCLHTLYQNKYIVEEVKIINKHPLHVILDMEKLNEKPFAQLSAKLLDCIDQIDYIGVRLLYYYESYIVRSDVRKQYCYPSIETIVRNTGISKNTVTRYNELLVKSKLLKIEKHKLGTEYSYNDNDDLIFDRYNNHYYVRVENIK